MRVDFDRETRKKCAARAGYRCSFPGCNRLTVGPGSAPSEVAESGSACHILPASGAGPRAVETASTRKDLGSLSNAIWLCASHAKLIDCNDGERYPAALLKSFRDEHEARIASEHEGLPHFRLTALEVGRSGIFRDGQSLQLVKVMLLAGDNGTGKSTLFRWLSWLGENDALWSGEARRGGEGGSFTVEALAPARHRIRVEHDSERLRFQIDGTETLVSPLPLAVLGSEIGRELISLEGVLQNRRAELGNGWQESVDDVNLLAEFLGMNARLLPGFLPFVGRFALGNFSNLRAEGVLGQRRIQGEDLKRKRSISIHQASESMLTGMMVDIRAAQLNHLALSRPALLLLDLPALQWDGTTLQRYVDFFASKDCRFQTLLSSPDTDLPQRAPSLPWVVALSRGRAPNCTVEAQSLW